MWVQSLKVIPLIHCTKVKVKKDSTERNYSRFKFRLLYKYFEWKRKRTQRSEEVIFTVLQGFFNVPRLLLCCKLVYLSNAHSVVFFSLFCFVNVLFICRSNWVRNHNNRPNEKKKTKEKTLHRSNWMFKNFIATETNLAKYDESIRDCLRSRNPACGLHKVKKKPYTQWMEIGTMMKWILFRAKSAKLSSVRSSPLPLIGLVYVSFSFIPCQSSNYDYYYYYYLSRLYAYQCSVSFWLFFYFFSNFSLVCIKCSANQISS